MSGLSSLGDGNSRSGAWAQATKIGRGALWIWDHSVGFVVAYVLIAVIWTYRMTISPLLPASCRFYPSCSAYGLQAIRVHGSAKGSFLATWRLLRCNPWNRGGIDPVPQYGSWRPDILPDGTPRTHL